MLRFSEELRLFLAARVRRAGEVTVRADGTSTLGHLVESAGVPLTEIGTLLVDGRAEPPSYRPSGPENVEVGPVDRPQRVEAAGFLLDVHLGTLARRLRVLGVDTVYHNDRDDEELVEEANAGHRILLTRDRGLLRRRRLWAGAYVRGHRPDDQLADVLDRFAPETAPWTRCTACNGTLVPVAKQVVEHLLEPGTRRTQDSFARCRSCGRAYWPGAHRPRLASIVERARER
ncbi:Mut7-C RNAse domain-containing protein [Spongiactinospora sp. TRM90649]|uniref:Mut7-C RNAse domain-containing protein n=1 Tax=Spongiactinospora sp. TRM90649 TaxID=3031114 RepID=UPI0023F9C8A1|nr:Mut7-C RNAse domain-containing protein [Spongiactinospora sp. TRM90649]MDF5757198.1 Mut7-C RNAse domain-containing protein [Spongiactinospora sp. TRM90649]